MHKQIEKLTKDIEKKTGKKMLSLEDVASYLSLEISEVEELIKHKAIDLIVPTVNKVRVIDVAKFMLGIHKEFTETKVSNIAPIANTALQSIQSLAEDLNEEDFNMAVSKYGEGSVYWNETRKKYQCAFYLTMQDGTKTRKIVTGTSEVDVISKMQAVKLLENSYNPQMLVLNVPNVPSIPTEPEKPKLTYGEVTEKYLKWCVTFNGDVTYHKKLTVLKPILSYFKDIPIVDIDRTLIQKFLQEYMYNENHELRSQDTIDNTYTILKAVFNYAMDEGYIQKLPTKRIVVPRGKQADKDSKYFTEEQLVRVYRGVLENPKYLTVTVLALGTGLRSEEFLALKWSNIDFDKMQIHIKEARIRKVSKRGKPKWTWAQGPVKTPSSLRTVPMDNVTANQLQKWKQHLIDTGVMKTAKRKGNDDFVFLDRDGEPQKYDRLRDNYNKWLVRRELGFRTTFHMFRHSFATWIRSKGGDPMVIKAFMGHSLQDDITEGVYTSITSELKSRTVDIINAFTQDIYDKAVTAGALIEPNGRNGKKKR